MNTLKITIAAAAVTLTALAVPASAKPSFQPISPAMQPIGGNSMFKPVNPALKPIANNPIYKPVNPALQPINAKGPGGCGKGWGGCNPNSWTPHHHGGFNVSLGIAAPVAVAAADDGCYYVHKKVFVPAVGLVRERVLVCD